MELDDEAREATADAGTSHTIAALGQAATLAILLVPGAGALSRYVGFEFDPAIANPMASAIAADLGTLAVSGLFAFVVLAPPYLLLWRRSAKHASAYQQVDIAYRSMESAAERMADSELSVSLDSARMKGTGAANDPARHEEGRERLRQSERDREAARAAFEEAHGRYHEAMAPFHGGSLHQFLYHGRSGTLVTLVVACVVVVACLFLPGFIPIALAAVPLVVSALLVRRTASKYGRVTLANTWAPTVATMAVSAVAWGLSYPTGYSSQYEFDQSTGMTSGWYTQIATQGNLVQLRACDTPLVIAVSQDSILTRIDATEAQRKTFVAIPPPLELASLATSSPKTGFGVTYRCPPSP